MDHEAAKAIAKTKQILSGHLEIDHDNGTAIFTSGGLTVLRITHLPTPIPTSSKIDVVAISNVVSYHQLIATPKSRSMEVHPSTGRYAEPQEEPAPALGDQPSRLHCRTCGEIHLSTDYTMWGTFTFIKGHEYIVWTRNSQQTYAHRGRMQYIGRSSPEYRLTFNARGPDRSTGDQFGGTQTIDARNIVKLEEVDRDPSKRYVDEIDRDMKRD